jgi:hypothetical protein
MIRSVLGCGGIYEEDKKRRISAVINLITETAAFPPIIFERTSCMPGKFITL